MASDRQNRHSASQSGYAPQSVAGASNAQTAATSAQSFSPTPSSSHESWASRSPFEPSSGERNYHPSFASGVAPGRPSGVPPSQVNVDYQAARYESPYLPIGQAQDMQPIMREAAMQNQTASWQPHTPIGAQAIGIAPGGSNPAPATFHGWHWTGVAWEPIYFPSHSNIQVQATVPQGTNPADLRSGYTLHSAEDAGPPAATSHSEHQPETVQPSNVTETNPTFGSQSTHSRVSGHTNNDPSTVDPGVGQFGTFTVPDYVHAEPTQHPPHDPTYHADHTWPILPRVAHHRALREAHRVKRCRSDSPFDPRKFPRPSNKPGYPNQPLTFPHPNKHTTYFPRSLFPVFKDHQQESAKTKYRPPPRKLTAEEHEIWSKVKPEEAPPRELRMLTEQEVFMAVMQAVSDEQAEARRTALANGETDPDELDINEALERYMAKEKAKAERGDMPPLKAERVWSWEDDWSKWQRAQEEERAEEWMEERERARKSSHMEIDDTGSSDEEMLTEEEEGESDGGTMQCSEHEDGMDTSQT